MKKPWSFSNAVANGKVFQAIGYVLVFLMLACGVMTLSVLIHRVLPGWHAGIIAALLLFIVIDRFYTYRQFTTLTPLTAEWAIAFGAQWILILVVSRFLLSYANGLDSLRRDLSLFTRGDLMELITPEYVFGLLLALLFWYLTGQFLDLLNEIRADQALALGEETLQPSATTAHQRLLSLIFSLGIGLVIVAALTRIDIHAAVDTDRFPGVEVTRVSGGEAGALLYFVLGLALLSLSRLMSLQTRWNRQRIPISTPNLAGKWGMYSILFLLILALFVGMLPAGDSLGFFGVLRTLFSFLMAVLFFIGQLILGLFIFLFSLPFRFIGRRPPPISSPPPRLPIMPEMPVSPTESSVSWALVRSILLWGSLSVLVVFALVQFIRQHDGVLGALRKSRLTNWLILAWQRLSRNAAKTGGNISQAISAGWQNLVARLERRRILPIPGWISLRALDPRRQVYFFYLAMIRRSDEKGVRRKASQTPSEYAVTLEQALPSENEDIESITKAFVEARYSRHDVSSGDASTIKTIWGRIRRALQNLSGNSRPFGK